MKKKIALAISGLVLILFFLFPSFWFYWKGIYLDSAKYPARGLEAVAVGLKESFFFFPRLISTYYENLQLRKEVETMRKSLVELQEVSIENKRLRQLLSLKENSNPYQYIASRVIGRDYSNWFNTVLINKGSLHGLKKNMAVVSHSGLVGRLIEVNHSTSRALLLIDSNCRITGIIQRTRDQGIVEGYLGRCRIKYLDPQADVKPGDTVITSGFGGAYPKGLLIGSVTGVGTEPGGMYKYAVIQPAVNFSRLEEVLCIR